MTIRANELRPGNIINHLGTLWNVVKTTHVKPGKGGAFIQTELKAIEKDTKLNERFRSDDTLDVVRVEERSAQFLYVDADQLVFMDPQTCDQIQVDINKVGERLPFLQDGAMVQLLTMDESDNTDVRVIGVKLPAHVVCTVADTQGVVKGQTASASFKPAELDNGVRIMVPPHITPGTRVVVSTVDCTYVERAKD